MYSDKSIDIKISKHNVFYYLEKGYNVNISEIHKIKSCDVIKTVSNKIYVICENCLVERDIKSCNYHNQLKNQNFYVCSGCSHVKIKKTNLEKYGSECPLQNKIIIEKTKKTLLREYGVDNISKLDSIRNDRKENFKMENFKNKSKITWLKKYGFDNPSKSKIIKEKKEKTTFINYGVSNPSHSSEIFEKAQISGKKIKKHECGLMYRGTYEKDFLDFCIVNNIKVEKGIKIEYYFNNKKSYYHSDFYIPNINLICEIKSIYYYNLYKERNLLKKEGSISSGFNFTFIIDKNYEEIKKSL